MRYSGSELLFGYAGGAIVRFPRLLIREDSVRPRQLMESSIALTAISVAYLVHKPPVGSSDEIHRSRRVHLKNLVVAIEMLLGHQSSPTRSSSPPGELQGAQASR